MDFVCVWSSSILQENRLAAEMGKWATMQGLMSNKTARTDLLAMDDEEERATKIAEANDPDYVEASTPLWDQAHGVNPLEQPDPMELEKIKGQRKGMDPNATNGKPPGTQDKS